MKIHFYQASKFLSAILVATTLLQGCIKDEIDLTKASGSFSPEYAAPLVYSSLTLKDIMIKNDKSGVFSTDANGFITLVYKGNLLSLKSTDLVNFPTPQVNNNSYILSTTDVNAVNSAPTGSQVTVSDSTVIDFQTGGQTEIATLNCKTATLNFGLSYGLPHDAVIKVSIPSASFNGNPFVATIPVTYSGTSPVVVNQVFSLDGYVIDMTNGGTAHNKIKIKYDITITKSTNTTTAGQGISFTESFDNVKYNSIIGYIGQQFLSPSVDTVGLAIFANNLTATGAEFNLVDPKIKVFLINSYGLPISASFGLFQGYSPGFAPFNITGAPNPLNIPVPTLAQIGQSVRDSFELNVGNSNIFTLINDFPKNVIYKINSQANPGGVSYTNFVTDSSQFKVDMQIELPMHGSVKNLAFQDTIAYSFSKVDQIESIGIRALINNGFPMDVTMRIGLVDSAYNVVHELLVPGQLIMQSATVGVNGRVTSPTQRTTELVIPSSVLPQLPRVKYMLVQGILNTTDIANNTNVKIYSEV